MQKRIFDIGCTLLGILVLIPIMLLISVCIKFDSPGPVIFRQIRVGRRGRPFNVLKFRTMEVNAENNGLSITSSGDARITRVGEFFRKYKLDEIPQLFNVIKGDMSLVGPRPEVPKFVECYPAGMKERILSVRPGVTDNASIEFRNENQLLADSSDPERCYVEEVLPTKLALYNQYIDNHTIFGDLVIIFRTIFAVMNIEPRRGKDGPPGENLPRELGPVDD